MIDERCRTIILPANACLDRPGDLWRFSLGYRLSYGTCVLG